MDVWRAHWCAYQWASALELRWQPDQPEHRRVAVLPAVPYDLYRALLEMACSFPDQVTCVCALQEEQPDPELDMFSSIVTAVPVLPSSAKPGTWNNGIIASQRSPVKGLLRSVDLTGKRGWGRYQALCYHGLS